MSYVEYARRKWPKAHWAGLILTCPNHPDETIGELFTHDGIQVMHSNTGTWRQEYVGKVLSAEQEAVVRASLTFATFSVAHSDDPHWRNVWTCPRPSCSLNHEQTMSATHKLDVAVNALWQSGDLTVPRLPITKAFGWT